MHLEIGLFLSLKLQKKETNGILDNFVDLRQQMPGMPQKEWSYQCQ